MASFSTYGLIGIGIASAIGFVFALSFLGNNTAVTEQQETFLLTSQLKQMEGQPEDDKQRGAPEASLMQQAEELQPTLTSIIALQSNREVIGGVVPEMQFEINKPVLIQASLANQNEAEIRQHTVILGIRAEGGFDEQLVSYQGDIAASGNTTLELYWSPDKEGNYTVVLFSMTPNDSATAEAPQPIAEIPVKVV
jgi:hypothetical protein